jgi:hypothetical protein
LNSLECDILVSSLCFFKCNAPRVCRYTPEQLPIVLQVLLSQSHRLRALVLLGRFLDMGPWAVDLALSVGRGVTSACHIWHMVI